MFPLFNRRAVSLLVTSDNAAVIVMSAPAPTLTLDTTDTTHADHTKPSEQRAASYEEMLPYLVLAMAAI
ncbi:hypothetical protein P3T18_003584 [Paraburkholderia sp. GAS199]|uniref:hypothetical protein n=1 Tax=Paraburkholderia sp. GAS199 TaxID=3035126 RepID=UPI003D1C875C